MSVVQAAASLQYVVSGPVSKTDGADLTLDEVEMAFLPYGTGPSEADWVPASWVPGGPPYQAATLIAGTDVVSTLPVETVVLEEGVYAVWVRVTDNPEIPAKVAGRLIMLGIGATTASSAGGQVFTPVLA